VPETVAALNVLIFLLPGFISQKMTEWLTAHGKSGDTEMIRDALIFSLINYLVYSIVALGSHHVTVAGSPFPPLPAVPLVISDEGILRMHGQQVAALATLVAISIINGAALATALESGRLFAAFRRLGLTNKNSAVDVWYDVFHEFPGRWLRVCFKDGHKIIGWPYYFSDDPENRELFLADALIEKPNGESGELEGPGVLIENMDEVIRIEVVDGGRNQNKNRETGGETINAEAEARRNN
jgi:hypothetical protein